jgi:hypothetical protein
MEEKEKKKKKKKSPNLGTDEGSKVGD